MEHSTITFRASKDQNFIQSSTLLNGYTSLSYDISEEKEDQITMHFQAFSRKLYSKITWRLQLCNQFLINFY